MPSSPGLTQILTTKGTDKNREGEDNPRYIHLYNDLTVPVTLTAGKWLDECYRSEVSVIANILIFR